MKFGCSFGIFLNSAHLICRSTVISCVSAGPFDFEITRVDCISSVNLGKKKNQDGSVGAHAQIELSVN